MKKETKEALYRFFGLAAQDAEPEELLRRLVNGGGAQGYLFQCLHCGKYLLWSDCD